jgi:hypothetical protein
MTPSAPYVIDHHRDDDGFSTWLQTEIDRAGVRTFTPHPKWPLVAEAITLPSGLYHMHNPVRLRSGVQILGSSQGSTALISHLRDDQCVFQSDPDEEAYAVKIGHLHAVSDNPFEGRFLDISNANRNCVFHDLFAENFDHGIKLTNCYTTAFRDIGLYKCRSGFYGENLTNGRVDNLKIENCSRHGFVLAFSDRNTTTGTDIRGLVCQGNGYSGVRLDGLDQVRFTSLFLEGNNRRATREDESEARFGQLSVVAGTDLINKRNGNLVFDSIFITPGHSDIVSSPAVDLEYAENIHFNGGYIRSNREAFRPAFRVGKGVNVCSVSGVTFQGFRETDIFEHHETTRFTTRDIVLVKPGTAPGKRFPDIS